MKNPLAQISEKFSAAAASVHPQDDGEIYQSLYQKGEHSTETDQPPADRATSQADALRGATTAPPAPIPIPILPLATSTLTSLGCSACGCPLVWMDGAVLAVGDPPGRHLHCGQCQPPPSMALARKWLAVVWDVPAGWAAADRLVKAMERGEEWRERIWQMGGDQERLQKEFIVTPVTWLAMSAEERRTVRLQVANRAAWRVEEWRPRFDLSRKSSRLR